MKKLILALLLTSSVASASTLSTDYEVAIPSQTTQTLGPVGGVGDIIERLIIVPITTGAGNVSITDGSNYQTTIFYTGTLSNLAPITVQLGVRSTSGAWKVTTGANVNVIAVGKFK